MQIYPAEMQPCWDDLRYLLAIRRGGTLAAAGRQLRVDATTVARRLVALQTALGATLCRRRRDGALELTPAGELAADQAEVMEQRFELACGAAGRDGHAGTVRLSAVPLVVNRLLAPAAEALVARNPRLELVLVPESREVNLTRREADLALRFARPMAGGNAVLARRIASLVFAPYGPRGADGEAADRIPWIVYDPAMAHLPQARWLARVTRGGAARVSALRVGDLETALEAAAAGLGRTLLPSAAAESDPRLVPLCMPSGTPPPPVRELWLLTHRDQRELPRIRAVTAWLESTFAARKRQA